MSLTSYRAAPPRAKDNAALKPRAAEKRTFEEDSSALGRPGDDLLSQVLRHSTIGAEEFNGRVRDGIGFRLLAQATRPAKDNTKQGVFWCCADKQVFAACGRISIRRVSIANESDQADQAISTG